MRISDWSSDVCSSDLAVSLIAGSSIFLVSTTIFHSSLVDPSSRKTSMWGMTLKAICLVNFLASAGSPTKMLRDCSNSSSMPTLTRSEEHTSELQSLMRISYAVLGLKKKNSKITKQTVENSERTQHKN